jgi:hypothetical protein
MDRIDHVRVNANNNTGTKQTSQVTTTQIKQPTNELQVSYLKIYQSSTEYTKIDIQIYNNSDVFLRYYEIVADIYTLSGQYLGHGMANGENLRPKQTATKQMLFADIQANEVASWKPSIGELHNKDGYDVTRDFNLNATQAAQPQIAGSGKHTSEEINAIKQFAFQGISLGATLAQIKAKYPDISFVSDLSDNQASTAAWQHDGWTTDFTILFTLYNEHLYDIMIDYPDSMLEQMGGEEAIYNKLVDKYGHEDKDTTKADGSDMFKTPYKLCEWVIPVGDAPSQAITITFKSGYGRWSYGKSAYHNGNEALVTVTDIDAFTEQAMKKNQSQQDLQKKANVGF